MRKPSPDRIRTCAGTCDRITRPSNVTKEEAPEGAAVRYNATHCAPCWRDVLISQNKPLPKQLQRADKKITSPMYDEYKRKQEEAKVADAMHARQVFEARRKARMGNRTPLQKRMELVSHRRKVGIG
jgi:hypothetical protein